MTPELELLFETQITNVSKNISSIYSREDVIIILKTLRHYIDELPKADEQPTIEYSPDNIVRAIKYLLDEVPFLDYVSCEPELHGSYGDSYSLEMNATFDEDEFVRHFVTDVESYFVTNKD